MLWDPAVFLCHPMVTVTDPKGRASLCQKEPSYQLTW